ncbi:MAG: bifunctional 4-hydroxy-2-oxoglutarate aldolase/2-dehydro-3-deoxy-phosphogluconate aldolase [Pseudomonadota bacterium]
MISDAHSMLESHFHAAPIVPLVDADDPASAIATANALTAGGLKVIEVVLRSDKAMDCMAAIAEKCSDVIVGAGTVLTVDQAEEAITRGARFTVSPGLVDDVVRYCLNKDVPIYPGAMTPGEVQRAYALGLRTVKFFPAMLAGGIPMLKALSSVFREMRFMPTGGVSADNLAEFLQLPSVIACGGSWLTPKAEIAAGNYTAITQLAEQAVAIARQIRAEDAGAL